MRLKLPKKDEVLAFLIGSMFGVVVSFYFAITYFSGRVTDVSINRYSLTYALLMLLDLLWAVFAIPIEAVLKFILPSHFAEKFIFIIATAIGIVLWGLTFTWLWKKMRGLNQKRKIEYMLVTLLTLLMTGSLVVFFYVAFDLGAAWHK